MIKNYEEYCPNCDKFYVCKIKDKIKEFNNEKCIILDFKKCLEFKEAAK